MNVLLVGGGPTSGASCMRADQLGAAIGARVHTHPHSDPSADDVEWAEVVVIVKRLKKRFHKWLAKVKASGKPLAWDALDFWKQPDTNLFDRAQMIEYFQKTRASLGASLAVAATEAMARDCGAVYLPHHHRLGLAPVPPRRSVHSVGYEGSDRYLTGWQKDVARACDRRDWSFVINPRRLTDVDIVVALRGGKWDGWACREWKSGVKYVNAIAAGRPVITQPAAAFIETRAPGSTVETVHDLDCAFDEWAPYDRRAAAAKTAAGLVSDYRIDAVAARYLAVLDAGFRIKK